MILPIDAQKTLQKAALTGTGLLVGLSDNQKSKVIEQNMKHLDTIINYVKKQYPQYFID
jgi:hypothetical protein